MVCGQFEWLPFLHYHKYQAASVARWYTAPPMVSSRTCLLLVALNALSASVSALHLEGLLNKRDGTTAAQCSSEFVWANNEQNKSACRVLAEIIAPCHGGCECNAQLRAELVLIVCSLEYPSAD